MKVILTHTVTEVKELPDNYFIKCDDAEDFGLSPYELKEEYYNQLMGEGPEKACCIEDEDGLIIAEW